MFKKILIIGGGWVGCHLAYKLKTTHQVSLFNKNDFLFNETSFNNQNRLHLGFHYPRNYKTREMCKNTFQRFIFDYGFLTESVAKNIYCIPQSKSIIDLGTYKEIFKNFDDKNLSQLTNIEGCVNTKELYINFEKAHDFFNQELKDVFIKKYVIKKEVKDLVKEYDLVIDSTNNHLLKFSNKSFYEPTITLLYRKIQNTQFDALTLVDGPFFSIYPYKDDLYTVTDVEYTPLKKIKTIKTLNHFYNNFKLELVVDKRKMIETKILSYYPNFLKDYTFHDYFLSTKSKIESASDSRYPVINKHDNFIQCFTGKIQGVYVIEDYITDYLKIH